jgi:hypothetical protein
MDSNFYSLRLINSLEKNNTILKVTYCKSSGGFKILDSKLCKKKSLGLERRIIDLTWIKIYEILVSI